MISTAVVGVSGLYALCGCVCVFECKGESDWWGWWRPTPSSTVVPLFLPFHTLTRIRHSSAPESHTGPDLQLHTACLTSFLCCHHNCIISFYNWLQVLFRLTGKTEELTNGTIIPSWTFALFISESFVWVKLFFRIGLGLEVFMISSLIIIISIFFCWILCEFFSVCS